MLIAVNTRLLLKNKLEGIGWFTYETLKRITQSHPEHEFLFIFDRPYSPDFIFGNNVKGIVVPPQARHPFLWYLFFEWSIPYIIKKYKPNVFLSTDGWIPLKTNIPKVNVIHDLNFEHNPQHIKLLTRKYYQYFFHRFAEKSTRIATVSEFTKQDIVQLYKQTPNKIDVVYNGVNENYHPINQEQKKETRKKYSEGCPYFIFVGAIHQRKNIANLFKAFDIFKQKIQTNVKLVIIGEKKWWSGEIENTFNAILNKDSVLFLGRMKPNELNAVMASSLALTYVSFFEGFGIPILEAFSAETAVITSNCTSMPEVAQDAAIYIDPFSPESIADAMNTIYSNPDLRSSLIEKGKVRKHDFSWSKSAEKLWNCIEKAIK